MSDLYSELLVKKKQTAKDLVVKYGLIALTVIMVLGGLVLNVLLLVPAIALGIACYFVIPKTDLEYEYHVKIKKEKSEIAPACGGRPCGTIKVPQNGLL